MDTADILSLAYRTIRSNRLRTGITIAIIAFGIMALIGIITAIQAMNQKLTESFSTMGANGFTIHYKQNNERFGGDGGEIQLAKKNARKEKRSDLDKYIRQDEAEQFVAHYTYPATTSLSTIGGYNFIVSWGSHKTNPNVILFGGDEQYLSLNGLNLIAGRNFSQQEISSAQSVCLLGYDVAKKLFSNNLSGAVGKRVLVDNIPMTVIGVLGSRGSSFGFSRDNIVLGGYRNVKRAFGATTFTIGVKTGNVKEVASAMSEAESLFRGIRKLQATEQDNFELERSDSVAEKAMSVLSYLTLAVIVIGFITLTGSAIGLMNIMLVSVTERTKEVGLIKAIGGKGRWIRRQFLLEAVLISFLGAFFGILLGVLVGNLFSFVLQTGFVVPWAWVMYGIIICSGVGLAAGIYPAIKAGKLNPIEALRYE